MVRPAAPRTARSAARTVDETLWRERGVCFWGTRAIDR